MPVRFLPRGFRTLVACAALLIGRPAIAGAAEPIRVLVIATYETGKDRGDTPGELQYWAERQSLDREIAVPGVDHPLLTNDRGLYAMVAGTTSRCAVQIMALAADPRFDLRRTYFLLAGIGGGDPNRISLGSAVAYRVGSKVTGELLPNWDHYRDAAP